jgi:hypothetical protein
MHRGELTYLSPKYGFGPPATLWRHRGAEHSRLHRFVRVFNGLRPYSALLAPLPVADSRVPKPWRKADRARTVERARYHGPPDARRRTQRVAIAIPGRKWTSLAEAVPRAEFAFVNAHLVLFTAGRERTKACSILVPTTG